MEKIIDNNQVTLGGIIVSPFRFSHEVFGEGFYLFDLSVERNSETKDIIPIMVSERLLDIHTPSIDKYAEISGQFRSYNYHVKEENRNRLLLSVFAREVTLSDEEPENANHNTIHLDGFICKKPIYRETPLGRQISDVVLAVNRPYGKSDYIPCICWGRNAIFASSLSIGTHVQLRGRVQSREYQKTFPDGTSVTRVAYEVSVCSLTNLDQPAPVE